MPTKRVLIPNPLPPDPVADAMADLWLRTADDAIKDTPKVLSECLKQCLNLSVAFLGGSLAFASRFEPWQRGVLFVLLITAAAASMIGLWPQRYTLRANCVTDAEAMWGDAKKRREWCLRFAYAAIGGLFLFAIGCVVWGGDQAAEKWVVPVIGAVEKK